MALYSLKTPAVVSRMSFNVMQLKVSYCYEYVLDVPSPGADATVKCITLYVGMSWYGRLKSKLQVYMDN